MEPSEVEMISATLQFPVGFCVLPLPLKLISQLRRLFTSDQTEVKEKQNESYRIT